MRSSAPPSPICRRRAATMTTTPTFQASGFAAFGYGQNSRRAGWKPKPGRRGVGPKVWPHFRQQPYPRERRGRCPTPRHRASRMRSPPASTDRRARQSSPSGCGRDSHAISSECTSSADSLDDGGDGQPGPSWAAPVADCGPRHPARLTFHGAEQPAPTAPDHGHRRRGGGDDTREVPSAMSPGRSRTAALGWSPKDADRRCPADRDDPAGCAITLRPDQTADGSGKVWVFQDGMTARLNGSTGTWALKSRMTGDTANGSSLGLSRRPFPEYLSRQAMRSSRTSSIADQTRRQRLPAFRRRQICMRRWKSKSCGWTLTCTSTYGSRRPHPAESRGQA